MNTNSNAAQRMDATERQTTYPIPIFNDILAEYRRLGDAIWLHLFYIDRTTEEYIEADGTVIGKVLGGVPRPDAYAASALGVCDRTIRNWRERLELKGFIRTKQTGHGSIVDVLNSRKWEWKRKRAARKESSDQTGKSVPCRAERKLRPDRNENVVPYIDSTETIQGQTNRPAAAVVDFIRKTYLEKTSKVLFVSKKSQKELEARPADDKELVAECWKVFLDREQGFEKLAQPVLVFLNDLPNLMEAVRGKLEKRQREKVRLDAIYAAHPEYREMAERQAEALR